MSKVIDVMKGLLFILLCSAGLSFGAGGNVRFAWLTDTHVGSQTGKANLISSVRDINSEKGLDFVIHSGDITESGSGALLREAKTILEGLHIRALIIPGNHDEKWSESGGNDLLKIFNGDRFLYDSGKYLFLGLHEGPVLRQADGHFAPEDLRWLDSVLAGRNKPIIFVTHYPVDDSIDNWFALLAILKKHDTRLILCGHGHSDNHFSFEGIPGVMARSNLQDSKKQCGYNLVSIKEDTVTFSDRISGVMTMKPWYSLVLKKIDFASDTAKYSRPDFSVNNKYPFVKTKWEHDGTNLIASGLSTDGTLVFTGSSSGDMEALSLKNGKQVWSFHTHGKILSTPAIAKSFLVFSSADGNIYCLNRYNGKLIWKYRSENALVASPGISGGKVFIGGSDGKFRALNLKDGSLIWSFEGIGGFVESAPLIMSDRLVFGAWDGFLYSVSKASGKLLWKWSNGTSEMHYSPAACGPVLCQGRIYIVAPDRRITVLNPEDGKQLYRTKAHHVRESLGVSEDHKTVFIRTMDDTAVALNFNGKELVEKWKKAVGYGYDFNAAPIVEKDGKIYFGTRNGFVYSVNSKDGTIAWVQRAGICSMNPVLPLSRGRILLSDMDGKVKLLEVKRK